MLPANLAVMTVIVMSIVTAMVTVMTTMLWMILSECRSSRGQEYHSEES
jgi:flagellar basal body-associated protein FliL